MRDKVICRRNVAVGAHAEKLYQLSKLTFRGTIGRFGFVPIAY
jgi:hypothetical protein